MITLENEGLIDIDALTTMGLNAKENENSIGYFGTGLKYAIATFLREGIAFKMFIGESEFEFSTVEKEFRGKVFHKCHMKGPFDFLDLGFTTQLGRNWQTWQAYREIASNCLDENGRIFKFNGKPEGREGRTRFFVDLDFSVNGVFIYHHDKELLFSNSEIEIYEGESEHVFYKGIRAKDLNKNSIYTYNILKDSTLTEDRLLCYDFQVEDTISRAITQMENKGIIKSVITADDDAYEHNIDANWNSIAPKEAFLETYSECKPRVNDSFKKFFKAHQPKAPRTRHQRRNDFKGQLSELCKEYGVDCNWIEAHTDSAMISGGILTN